jgi:hypothetical protein
MTILNDNSKLLSLVIGYTKDLLIQSIFNKYMRSYIYTKILIIYEVLE